MNADKDAKMDITSDSAPCVPVFNCLVYVGPRDGGGVRARVANLTGLQCVASDERSALGQLVKAFKKHLAECLEQGVQPAWIDPPLSPEGHEQTRWIPVHL